MTRTLLAVVVALWSGLSACGSSGNTPGPDADGDALTVPGTGGLGGGSGAGGGGGGGESGAGGGDAAGAADAAGVDGGNSASDGPDLSNCPIRSCIERFRALQAACSGFDVACVHERYGTQDNYCMANGVRMYFDHDGTTGLATIIKPDGRTCYTVYETYALSGRVMSSVVRDPDEAVVFVEMHPAAGGAYTIRCDSTSWVTSDTRCGVVSSVPYTACPDSTAGTCRRP